MQSGAYRPAACNIGPAEIRMRLWAGHLGLLATVTFLVVLLVRDAEPAWRLLIAAPATATAIGYLQAWLRFCVALGMRGYFNFGSEARHAQRVSDPEARRRDRVRAFRLGGASLLIGLSVAALSMLI